MRAAPVIPVLVIERVEDALPIARALVAGGLPVLEVTLRTPAALDAIRAMKEVEGAIVGAGTVLDPRQLDAAAEAGAEFAVSPGLTEAAGQGRGRLADSAAPGRGDRERRHARARPRLLAAQILPGHGRGRPARR